MRTIILAAMLACFALMVPLEVLVIQTCLQAPSVPQYTSGFDSDFMSVRDGSVTPEQTEPGSGGGGEGVI